MRATLTSIIALLAESWLNDRGDNTNRGTILATYMACLLGSTAAGRLLLNLAPPASCGLFILATVVLSLSLVWGALTTTATHQQIEREVMPLRKLFRKAPLGIVGCLSGGMLTGSFWSLGAVDLV